jgi:hypothetical protein
MLSMIPEFLESQNSFRNVAALSVNKVLGHYREYQFIAFKMIKAHIQQISQRHFLLP